MRTYNELLEGLQDPNIFKAFFLGGGPGSGKSYVVGKTTGGTGLVTVNSDTAFETMLAKEGLSSKMPASETEARDVVRKRAKTITSKKKEGLIAGRMGLIIDGTGKDHGKIIQQSISLKQIGYDTHMIFVNTSLDVALERNAKRDRSVPEPIVVSSWRDVQNNLGKFSQHFKGNLIIVDNNDAGEDVFVMVFKQIRGLLRKPVKSPIAKQWVEMEMKARGISKAPKGF